MLEAYTILTDDRPISARIARNHPNFNQEGKSDRERYNRPFTQREREEIRRNAEERRAQIRKRKERMEERKYQAFKKTTTFRYARFIRVAALVIGLLLVVDVLLPETYKRVPIEALEARVGSTEEVDGIQFNQISGYYLGFCGRSVRINSSLYQAAEENDLILIRQSRLFKEVTGLRLEKAGFTFGASGDSPIYPMAIVLLFPLLTWILRFPNEPFFRMIFATNLIGTVTLAFILLESWRVLRLLQITGC